METKSWGSLNSFSSLEGLSKLSPPIIDCSLLSIRISYEGERPLHLVNLEEYLTDSAGAVRYRCLAGGRSYDIHTLLAVSCYS
jgi:hypothetical protein